MNQVFQGQGRPLETFIPQGMRGYAPELAPSQKFDVSQARATLAAAGVSAAQLSGLKLSYDKSVDFAKLTAQFVHDQLKTNLGVDIALDPLDAGTLGAKLENGSFDMAGPLGWNADYPDPADWFQIFTTTNSYNYSLYQNPRYDSLVAVAATDVQAQPPRRRVLAGSEDAVERLSGRFPGPERQLVPGPALREGADSHVRWTNGPVSSSADRHLHQRTLGRIATSVRYERSLW